MDKTHCTILLVVFVISCVSFALYIVSISTNNWVEAVAKYKDSLNSSELVHYGLFSGTSSRQVLDIRTKYNLAVTCDYGRGVCMYSCQEDSESRKAELIKILNNEQLETCPSQPRSLARSSLGNISARDEDITESVADHCLPASFWVCTVLFVFISMGFAGASAVFSLINMIYSPVEPIFNIFGLYIWNAVAASSSMIAFSFWAALFNQYLTNNIAISDTLNSKVPFISEGRASIGFSYYIMITAFVLNLANIGLLALRMFLINRQTEPPTITIDKNDAPLEFY